MPPSLLHEFDALLKYLTAAREVVQSGHMPDLTGMDGRVTELCDRLTQADPDIQQACLAKLTIIVQNLDACEKEMRVFHDAQMKGHA